MNLYTDLKLTITIYILRQLQSDVHFDVDSITGSSESNN